MTRNIWVAGIVMAALNAAPALAQERVAYSHRQDQALVEHRSEKKDLDGVMRMQNDAALANQIAAGVRRYVRYSIFDDVQIGVDGGVATLSGRVTMPYKSNDLGKIAGRVQGVREVRNELTVLPVSIYDDRLRRSIAQQIYHDGLFQTYAFHVNPPIHIIVERGNVTLTGAVSSEVERRKAEFIARSTFGVFNVLNRLVVAS